MKHMLYLTSNKRVCEYPTELGEDFVYHERYPDVPGESCKNCLALLMTYNKDQYLLESQIVMESNVVRRAKENMENEDPLGPAKGILIALFISSAFWITLFLVIWGVWFR